MFRISHYPVDGGHSYGFPGRLEYNYLHPGRLTWNLQISHLERKIIFQTSMIMFHVNLPGCNMFRCCLGRKKILVLRLRAWYTALPTDTPPKANISPEKSMVGIWNFLLENGPFFWTCYLITYFSGAYLLNTGVPSGNTYQFIFAIKHLSLLTSQTLGILLALQSTSDWSFSSFM